MTLYDLKNVLQFDCDVTDLAVDARVYVDIASINEKYAKQIKIDSIYNDLIICDISDFIKHHKTAIRKYLLNNYYPGERRQYLMSILTSDNIHSDGGYAVAAFIENDFNDFITEN